MADPYDARYFTRCFDPPYGRDDIWLTQFGRVADWIVAALDARTVLDAGCAMGLLVEALRDRGVEGYGIDISEHALDQVREDVKLYCAKHSIAEPLDRSYDAIVCIEVLEHISPEDGQAALDNLCAHTDTVIFSSTPVDFVEATHLNVQPPEHWAAAFATRGFFRDFELDATVATPWATVFRRQAAPLVRLVSGYERRLWHLAQDAAGSRAALDGMRDEIAEHVTAEATAQTAARDARADADAARTAEQVARTDAVRAEAESAARAAELEQARAARAELDALRATRTFRYTDGARDVYRRMRARRRRTP